MDRRESDLRTVRGTVPDGFDFYPDALGDWHDRLLRIFEQPGFFRPDAYNTYDVAGFTDHDTGKANVLPYPAWAEELAAYLREIGVTAGTPDHTWIYRYPPGARTRGSAGKAGLFQTGS